MTELLQGGADMQAANMQIAEVQNCNAGQVLENAARPGLQMEINCCKICLCLSSYCKGAGKSTS